MSGTTRTPPEGLALTIIAVDLGMSKSTILRLSAPLMEADLLLRDSETGWFRLGPGALRLGQAYLSSIDPRTVAREPLRRLLQAAHETCHLVVYGLPDVEAEGLSVTRFNDHHAFLLVPADSPARARGPDLL